MNKFPLEILNQIFLLLHSQHKVECMTVCRQWKHAIENSCLFHTVRVSSMTQMNKLMTRVQQNPKHGSKVERLILDMEHSEEFDMSIVPVLFPSVRVFMAFNILEQSGYPQRVSSETASAAHPWHKSVQHIAEYASGINIPQLLTLSVCPRLTKLSIFGDDEQHGKYIVDLLKNAPALKTLNICGFCFKLSDIELLHAHLPNLDSLSIDDAEIDCDVPVSDIKPAVNVKALELKATGVFTAKDEIILLQYITKKYPNLLDVSYGVVILDEVGYDLGKVYTKGLLPFLEGLGAQLKTLSLGLNNELIFPFQLLDNAGCRIKKLVLGLIMGQHVLEQIAQSDQVNYIEILIVNYIVDYNTLTWLRGFKRLRELNLCHPFQRDQLKRKKIINASELLPILGNTLETLTLRGVQLTFNASVVRHYPLINSISLVKVTIPPGLDHFITQSFPNLKSLTFQSCDWTSEPFVLPATDLSYLEITDKFPQGNDVLLIKTLNNDESRWYTAKSKYDTHNTKNQFSSRDAPIYPAITSLPFDKYSGHPFITFVCRSLHTFFMMNSTY